MADIKALECLMDNDVFYGEGEINVVQVEMEYSPGKYNFTVTPPIIGNMIASSTDVIFTAPYNITGISLGMVGYKAKHKLSPIEMKVALNSGTLIDYLWADPRYVLKLSKDVYQMRIDDGRARKMEADALADPDFGSLTPYVITAEMHFHRDYIIKMITRAAMDDGGVVDEEEIFFTR